MFLRNCLRTFSGSRVRLLLNNSTPSTFVNHKSVASLSTSKLALKNEKVKVTFVLNDGKRLETEANIGDSLLDVVVNNDLNIEGFGACEGTVTCSTCHVILKPEDFERQGICAKEHLANELQNVLHDNELHIPRLRHRDRVKPTRTERTCCFTLC